MTTVEDAIRLLQDLLQVLTRIADDANRRDVLGDDQPHYTYVKTLTVPPDHVTPVYGANGEIIAYKVRVRT